MRSFQQFLSEAKPNESLHGIKWFHGTHSTAAANSIKHEGIKPREITSKKLSRLEPMRGKVYMARHLSEALMYAVGGDVLGSGWVDTPEEDRIEGVRYSMPKGSLKIDTEPYGYVFVIPGTALREIDPDEDSVGEIVSQVANKSFHGPMGAKLKAAFEDTDAPWDSDRRRAHTVVRDMVSMAKSFMTPRQYRDVMDGFIDQQAAGGKRMMPHIPDWMKLVLIDLGANVAHTGLVHPTECWRFDRRRDVPRLTAANFFEIAEKF